MAISPTGAAGERPRIGSIVGGLAGNLIEWYDFLAYSIFSIYFAPAFFPADRPTVQLMNTAAIAAVGYIARPAGSWLVGVYADRRGRKAALMMSVGLMMMNAMSLLQYPAAAANAVVLLILVLLTVAAMMRVVDIRKEL